MSFTKCYITICFILIPLFIIASHDVKRLLDAHEKARPQVAVKFMQRQLTEPDRAGQRDETAPAPPLPYVRPNFVSKSDWKVFVSYGEKYGADPYLLAAISLHETHHGRLGAGRQGYFMGVGVPTHGKRLRAYRGLENQVAWAAPRLAKHMNGDITYQKLRSFARNVWRPDNPDLWAAGVWNWYCRIKPKG